MAYNKQTWVNYPNLSSPITADRLNHMEDGIEEAYNHGGGGGGVSVGTILPYSGSTIPNGFMLCDGSAISRTTYAELFSIIGTTYGAGDGSTTFNIPDLKGRVGVGIDSNDTDFDTLGETGGEKTHTLTIQEMPSHYHDENYGSARWVDSGGQGSTASGNHVTYAGGGSDKICITANTGGGQAHNNLQPYVVINYIIRVTEAQAGEVACETLPVGSEIDFDGTTSEIPTGWEQVGDKAQILWENPNPNDDFAAQNITLNSNDYDTYEIYYKHAKTDQTLLYTKSIKGYGCIAISQLSNGTNFKRVITYVDDTTLNIGSSTSASNLTPQYVIGCKTGLFS